jgi:membrane-associated phospholipid phosphatase
VAHQFDSNVRRHFTGNAPSAFVANPHSLQDAIPAAALFVGTWGYAQLIDDSDGRHEAGAMLEAAVLSIGPAYALKYATGRKLPNQTSDPNGWSPGSGGSFPSEHTTAAFAIGTVLAESGNGEYRWIHGLRAPQAQRALAVGYRRRGCSRCGQRILRDAPATRRR